MKKVSFLLIVLFLIQPTVGFSDGPESELPGDELVEEGVESVKRVVAPRSRARAHQSRPSTEGTQAIRRISTDPVRYSPYKLNGQSLEVDPE
jgi:hypothetical protein